jgi:molybdopterin-containing oxidoreductase family membrane subunit
MNVRTPTIGSMTDDICAITLRKRAPLWWILTITVTGSLTALLVIAIVWLFYAGVGIWGIDWPDVWGFALINYVWWIAIASGGTFISALFYLLQVEWRTSLNRLAETMTLFAVACAGIYPILHLGRPWLFYWLFPYPSTMGVWPQFRSPLLWDFFAILTYVVSSILFWYLGLVPDLATLRDRAKERHKQLLYGVLALGFRGEDRQWRHYRAAYGVLAAIMAPLVISVHSIVGLDFAGAATVGWHSTQFPPFFVFGALLSGFAMVLLLVVPLRHLLRLQPFITGRHLDVLSKLMLMSSLLVGYAYLMDVFSVFYSSEQIERVSFMAKVHGPYAPIYWATIVFNIAIPQVLWSRRFRVNDLVIALVSLGIIVGMWCERYTIVVMSVRRTHLPSSWGDFHGTFWDWATLWGTVGLFLTGMLLAVRYVPVISMFEMRGLLQDRRAGRSGEP